MMKILIVEDEPIIARRIERLSREILGDEPASFQTAFDLDDAQSQLFTAPVDLVFLDINLHGRDGFELLKTAVSGSFHVVIVSAQTDHAVRAFEFGVLDFIAKPFNRDRLERSFDRLREIRESGPYTTKYLSVRRSGKIDLIRIEDIRYIQGAGSYSELHLRDGSTELHDKSLDRLLAVLPPDFERIHKSYIVPMSKMKRILVHEGSRYEAELHDGSVLPVGRTRLRQMRKKLRA